MAICLYENKECMGNEDCLVHTSHVSKEKKSEVDRELLRTQQSCAFTLISQCKDFLE